MAKALLRRNVSVLAAGFALLGVGYGLAHVRAEGAPTAQPLWYSGSVADDKGTPLEGNHKVSVRLFATLTGGAAECVVGPSDVAFQKGRFRADVSACLQKVQTRADLFAELSVDDESKPFQRAKVGAVPYAIEAQHAVSSSRAKLADKAISSDTATNAANAANAENAANASGALKTQIDALSGRVSDVNYFVRPGNNGTVSCSEYCTDSSGRWPGAGPRGFCLGARDTDTGLYYGCDVTLSSVLGHLASQQCYCGRGN